MANAAKVTLIGRLTADPEIKQFGETTIANVRFVTNERKKNNQTGEWEESPIYLDCTAFGKTAQVFQQYTSKGSQVYIDGHLSMDRWTDKQTGQERSKIKVIVDSMQMIGAKKDGQQSDGGEAQQQRRPAPNKAGGNRLYEEYQPENAINTEDIPF